MVISDEIYEHLIYGHTKHVSIASFGKEAYDHTITVNGVSKAYSMTGWRIGYCGAPLHLAKAMANLQSHTTSNPTSIAQRAAVEALNGPQESVRMMHAEFEKRRNYMYKRLSSIPGVSLVMPEGAFYCFPDISAIGLDSMTFASRLLQEAHVAVVPGIAFGDDKSIRLSYATSMQNIEKGMDRMEKWIKSL